MVISRFSRSLCFVNTTAKSYLMRHFYSCILGYEKETLINFWIILSFVIWTIGRCKRYPPFFSCRYPPLRISDLGLSSFMWEFHLWVILLLYNWNQSFKVVSFVVECRDCPLGVTEFLLSFWGFGRRKDGKVLWLCGYKVYFYKGKSHFGTYKKKNIVIYQGRSRGTLDPESINTT